MDGEVLQLTREALWLVLILSAPPIIAASVIGLLVAFIQAATQLQEQTFPYALKLAAVVITILLTASLAGGALFNFSDQLFQNIPRLVG